MKRYLALSILAVGISFFFSSAPEVSVAALEKGPQPNKPLRREAALANFALTDLFNAAVPKELIPKGPKVLLTGREQEDQKEKFSNHENINEAANALNQVRPKFSAREENGRMEAVDFLVQSLTQSDDPAYTLGAISEVILSDNLYQTQDLDYRKSLVGDRVELFQAVALTHPDVAQNLFQRAQGTSIAKVLRFAKGRADFNAQIAMGH